MPRSSLTRNIRFPVSPGPLQFVSVVRRSLLLIEDGKFEQSFSQHAFLPGPRKQRTGQSPICSAVPRPSGDIVHGGGDAVTAAASDIVTLPLCDRRYWVTGQLPHNRRPCASSTVSREAPKGVRRSDRAQQAAAGALNLQNDLALLEQKIAEVGDGNALASKKCRQIDFLGCSGVARDSRNQIRNALL